MSLPRYFELNNGHKVPAVGLGTFQSEDGNALVKDVVKLALRLGYRHIDTAHAYGNEKAVGEAIRESGIPREELFVTSKLAQTWHHPDDVEQALDTSLKDLQLDYVDLYLMHFPHAYQAGNDHQTIRRPDGSGKPLINYSLSRRYPETWKAMERLVDAGKARSIGVQAANGNDGAIPSFANHEESTSASGLSNFNILKTTRILQTARIVPAVNQVELHPYLPQKDLLEFSSQHGILLMAHQPLGGRPISAVRGHPDEPRPTEDPKIEEMAAQLGITPAQMCLSWAIQRGTPVVPKSTGQTHMTQNLQLQRLPEGIFEEVEKLHLARGPIRFLDPSRHIGFDIFDEEKDQPVDGDESLL